MLYTFSLAAQPSVAWTDAHDCSTSRAGQLQPLITGQLILARPGQAIGHATDGDNEKSGRIASGELGAGGQSWWNGWGRARGACRAARRFAEAAAMARKGSWDQMSGRTACRLRELMAAAGAFVGHLLLVFSEQWFLARRTCWTSGFGSETWS